MLNNNKQANAMELKHDYVKDWFCDRSSTSSGSRCPNDAPMPRASTWPIDDKEEEEDEQTLKPDPRFTNDDGNLKHCSFGP
ncbi:unnamed protein product [Arctogadus glacialis]